MSKTTTKKPPATKHVKPLSRLNNHSKGICHLSPQMMASQVVLVVKNLLANAGNVRDTGSIPGSGRSPGEGHGNPLQYTCLENPMDRGNGWAIAHGVAQSQTGPK